jgi:hypothetical protein
VEEKGSIDLEVEIEENGPRDLELLFGDIYSMDQRQNRVMNSELSLHS